MISSLYFFLVWSVLNNRIVHLFQFKINTISKCQMCTYFIPDNLYPNIGHCRLFREEIHRVRHNIKKCGPNASYFEEKMISSCP